MKVNGREVSPAEWTRHGVASDIGCICQNPHLKKKPSKEKVAEAVVASLLEEGPQTQQNLGGLSTRLGVKSNSSEVISVQLDIAVEPEDTKRGDVHANTVDWASKYGCTARLIKKNGPGGGWPVYEFSGTKQNILRLVKNYDPDNYADYLSAEDRPAPKPQTKRREYPDNEELRRRSFSKLK